MRLGLLGGSFDPPHTGHLLAASDAYEALELDRLLFIPAGQQPFKQGRIEATGAQRLEMLRLLVGDDPRFGIETAELERPGLSYTVDTLAAVRAREPAARLYLLIGEDLTGEMPRWREAERIAQLAEVVLLTRGTSAACIDAEAAPAGDAGHRGGAPEIVVPMTRIATRRVDISAREIRARVRAGRSIRGFVPDAVAAYIGRTALYRERTTC
ncbi:MAG TPA: nicotinate-nucleotide adenylyltransferase [Gemmatimonadaceae bacterium]|nr:nicotinate-nucleotide adenylyltransferase [Gemmatimonadaceae bacterium]